MDNGPIRNNRRILLASLVGTAVEYYDFYIYGFAAALVFGPLFFPAQSAAAQTLLSLMTFGIAFFARPVGAVAFGHFGDRVGRKSTLVASLLMMGGCTLAIAFLPTYATAGWLAPALLCLMRFGQGFGLGGEWAGAALLSIENAPRQWQARFGAAPALGSMIGNIVAIGMFLAMGVGVSDADFAAWGWRIPFLASALLVVIGLWVRLSIGETPEFRAAIEREPPARIPAARLLAEHPGAVLAGCAIVVSPFAINYMANTFALAHATAVLGFDRNVMLLIQLAGWTLAIPVLLFAARLGDRRTPTDVVAIGGVATIALGLAFGPALASDSLPIAGAALFAANLIWAIPIATLSACLSGLFSVRVRYSGFAIAFNAGGVIGGAILPIIAQLMSAAGAISYVGLLLTAAGLLTFGAAKLARPVEGKIPADPATTSL